VLNAGFLTRNAEFTEYLYSRLQTNAASLRRMRNGW